MNCLGMTRARSDAAPEPARLAGGRSLPHAVAGRMSARFGHRFSSVRIHDDRDAAHVARAAGARALTVGHDIVFGEEGFRPGTRDGQRLLAHELAHVVQQDRHGPGDATRQSRHADASERDARRAADRVAAGKDARVQAAPDAAVARDGDPSAPAVLQAMLNSPLYSAITNNAVSAATAIGEEGATGGYMSGVRRMDDYWDMTTGLHENRYPGPWMQKPGPGPVAAPPEAPRLPWSTADWAAHRTWPPPPNGGIAELPGPAPTPPTTAATPMTWDESQWAAHRVWPEPPGGGRTELPPAHIGSMIEEELSGTGGRAPVPNSGAEPLNPAEFGRTGPAAATEAENIAQQGSRWAGPMRGLNILNKGLGPLGVFSNTFSLLNDLDQGNYVDAAMDAAGGFGSGVGFANAFGVAPALGPAGAVAGSLAGGYALGKLGLGYANDYAKSNDIFGGGRDSTDTAADFGVSMREGYRNMGLPDWMAGVGGAGAAIGGSWGTAAYSGAHYLASNIPGLEGVF